MKKVLMEEIQMKKIKYKMCLVFIFLMSEMEKYIYLKGF